MNPLTRRILLPIGAGLLGAAFLTGLYLGIVSLAESPAHALDLFWEDKAFVIPILLGFGTQVGLYTLLKKGLYMPMHVPAGGATTAAGGGMSQPARPKLSTSAHHVADVLPLVGLTAAATFLANWKVPFMLAGLIMNVIGIAIMVREILKARRHALARLAKAPIAS